MREHEALSVLITDNKGTRGTGTLFYTEGSDYFYVLTCAHVIYLSEAVDIHILVKDDDGIGERIVKVDKGNFHFSPLDEPEVIGERSVHTCDIAVIECEKGDIPLSPTKYAMYPMSSGERVKAVGYPLGTEKLLYYQQDELKAEVIRVQSGQDYFLIRVDEEFMNESDREAELKGFSGSPVWDEEYLQKESCLLGGLIAGGVGSNISRGRVKVMSARLLQNLMKDEFGIVIETRLPFVPESDMAPGYIAEIETPDQITVRNSWVENERRKAKTYIDSLQLKKSIDISRKTIGNSEFAKCTPEQKYSVYAILLEAYRLARDFDVYDDIVEEMHKAGISNEREDLTEAIRYYEAQELDKAREYIDKAVSKNPVGNVERVLSIAIKVESDKDADISILADVLGAQDQLLIKPQDEEEEEGLYQILGFILGNRFRETGRAIRCLNRAYQVTGNPIILETLGVVYYFHSIRDAYIEEGSDRIDRLKIYNGEIEKAREALLRVFSYADEMWVKGTFRRAGLQIFKCFYFMNDKFRIYKHYHDVMKYFTFPDTETKRDIQICYLETAILKERVDLNEFEALTDYDKAFFELQIILNESMRLFDGGVLVDAPISEKQLLMVIDEAERRLKQLIDTREDDRLGFDGIHSQLINLYGNGILRYHWNAVPAVEHHMSEMKMPLADETFSIYLEELKTDDIGAIEEKYKKLFESHKDVITFNEWIHFCVRHGMPEKAKALYESVFEERSYLIEDQPEYFYRSYIEFTMHHGFNLKPAIKCFIENRDTFKDIFIYMIFEVLLNFATVTFNDPDSMIEDLDILLDEGLIEKADHDEKCLIVNMLNCRPNFAEKYAAWAKGVDPINSTFAERMLLVWKGAPVEQNLHWNSMKNKSIPELVEFYKNEDWLRNPEEILAESNTANNRDIVVDLWSLYLFVKDQSVGIFQYFRTVYVTHNTVSMALQEINQVTDDDIKKVLIPLQIANNVKFLSPTLAQQLEVRSEEYEFREIHSACLLAKVLNCPALVGEFRFPIPKELQGKVIRPTSIDSVMECVTGIKLLRG